MSPPGDIYLTDGTGAPRPAFSGRALLAAGRSRLLAWITKNSHGQQGAARTDAWRAAAQAAVDLYGEHPAVADSGWPRHATRPRSGQGDGGSG